MHFDHIDYSHKYVDDVLRIVRLGIDQRFHTLKKQREALNTQSLVEIFNIIGTTSVITETWIGAQKEHERQNGKGKEDIYFHLNDDSYTRIFYIEAKRLPKHQTINEEEYVIGESSSGNPSGGIQRYKLGIHGNYDLKYNGMIAFVENKSIEEWNRIINNKISKEYPNDTLLLSTNFTNEYLSTHAYQNIEDRFSMYHFWINLIERKV